MGSFSRIFKAILLYGRILRVLLVCSIATEYISTLTQIIENLEKNTILLSKFSQNENIFGHFDKNNLIWRKLTLLQKHVIYCFTGQGSQTCSHVPQVSNVPQP